MTASAPTLQHPDSLDAVVTDVGVYAPQDDSRLLIETLYSSRLAAERRVLDLCTGSGVLALAAGLFGAAEVTAFDISPLAVHCARTNVDAAGVDIEVRLGSLSDALACGPFDVVLCNPPYVPVGGDDCEKPKASPFSPALAWNGGPDGRLFVDPLCAAAAKLLVDGGTMLLVQSEFCGVERSVAVLRSGGLDTNVVRRQSVPFGPVLSAQARRLESTGQLRQGYRRETLAVIRADKS